MLQLIDKGYYDYDFEKVDAPEKETLWEDTIKSDEEISSLLSGFGIGVKPTPKDMNTEELQKYIINQENHGS